MGTGTLALKVRRAENTKKVKKHDWERKMRQLVPLYYSLLIVTLH